MGAGVDNTAQPMRQSETPMTFPDLYSRFSPEEMARIVEVKRFLECIEGDTAFRDSVDSGQFTLEQLQHLRTIGITFDVDEVALMWKAPEIMTALFTQLTVLKSIEELPPEILSAVRPYPLWYLWARFTFLKSNMYRHHNCLTTVMPHKEARFAAWRRRRITATWSELGSYGVNIDHPTLAIELAVGCSVGCYFCAFDAPKLQTVFDYTVPENQAMFRGIAQSLMDVFGQDAAGHALLYWSTEPNDNPHYLDFVKEYQNITSRVVCTCTARYNEEWIRSLIEYYRLGPYPWPRISVLSRKVMQRLHQQFTPDEFRDVYMVMQQRDNEPLREKVPGGRPKMLERLDDISDIREQEEAPQDDGYLPQGSIACVSGLLINIVNKTIKLVSPCYTTEQYPYGYRVFDEATFATASEFDQVLRDMVERKMVLTPYGEMPLRFRDDLQYRQQVEGFELVSRYQVHTFRGNEVWGPLGALIERGDLTYGEVCDALVDQYECDPMLVWTQIQALFDKGFLDELAVSCPPTEVTQGTPTAPTPVGA